MQIISIEFRNFASYGNALQRLDFEEKNSHLYLVLGGNGFGKSTIANVIIFGLYGHLKRNQSIIRDYKVIYGAEGNFIMYVICKILHI